jgi:Mg2+/Co2+ transporter CorB
METVNVDMFLVIILLCILLSAFFSASETALTAVSRSRLFALAQEGIARALQVGKLRDKKDAMIGTILLGNTFVNSVSASMITVLCVYYAGDEYGALIAAFITTFVLLIFTEILPKTVAIHHTERVSFFVAPLIELSIMLLRPLTWLIQRVVWGILRVFGVDLATAKSLTTATDAIRGAIEMHHSEGEVEKGDKDMLGSILDLSHRELREVTVHRNAVVSIDMAQDADAIIAQMITSGHSRVPLWKDEPDNIIGILHVKDLLKLIRQQKIGITREMIRHIAQKPWFVPETTALSEQLLAFRQKRKHFACVVDEYGAWQGIVTLEDILEEIVGEIDDEHDPLEISDIVQCGEEAVRVAGTVSIRDLNRHQEWNMPDGGAATTIAGLVLHEARVIPEVGAIFEFFGYRFTVEERKANQITKLLVEKLMLDEGFDDAQE